MKRERMETFSDAVLAIVMTILVLDLDKPETPDLAGVWALREVYFSYALSFFWLGAMWINQYRIWHRVEKVTGRVLWTCILMLFFASLIPYVTSYAGANFYNEFAQCFYGVVVLCVSACNFMMIVELSNANEHNAAAHKRLKGMEHWMELDMLLKIVGILLAIFVWPPLAMISIIVGSFILSIYLGKEYKKMMGSKEKESMAVETE